MYINCDSTKIRVSESMMNKCTPLGWFEILLSNTNVRWESRKTIVFLCSSSSNSSILEFQLILNKLLHAYNLNKFRPDGRILTITTSISVPNIKLTNAPNLILQKWYKYSYCWGDIFMISRACMRISFAL